MNPIPKSLVDQQGVVFPLTKADIIHEKYNSKHAKKVLLKREEKIIEEKEAQRILKFKNEHHE